MPALTITTIGFSWSDCIKSIWYRGLAVGRGVGPEAISKGDWPETQRWPARLPSLAQDCGIPAGMTGIGVSTEPHRPGRDARTQAKDGTPQGSIRLARDRPGFRQPLHPGYGEIPATTCMVPRWASNSSASRVMIAPLQLPQGHPPMRLSPEEIAAIRRLVGGRFGADAGIWLFGSRLDDNARGGDVDLYVEPERLPDENLLLARQALRRDLERRLRLPVDLLINSGHTTAFMPGSASAICAMPSATNTPRPRPLPIFSTDKGLGSNNSYRISPPPHFAAQWPSAL